jgi:hypothetical protein
MSRLLFLGHAPPKEIMVAAAQAHEISTQPDSIEPRVLRWTKSADLKPFSRQTYFASLNREPTLDDALQRDVWDLVSDHARQGIP